MIKRWIYIGVIFSCFISSLLSVSASILDEQKEGFLIYGYAFVDEDRSGVMLSDNLKVTELKLELWQGHNLIAKTNTDDTGYYEFLITNIKESYYVMSEELVDYEPTKLVESNQNGNRFTYYNGKKIKSQIMKPFSNTYQNNIGFYEKEYLLSYVSGLENRQEYKNKFHKNDYVFLKRDINLNKQGYQFLGWCQNEKGKGQIYREHDVFIMPNHTVRLYPIWQKTMSQANHDKIVEIKPPQDNMNQYIYGGLLLVVFTYITVIIVKKSLKHKNR